MGRDVEYESEKSSEYECFHCGETVVEANYPGDCPACGRPMRNRGTPLE